jgi:hypothetical protein
VVDGLVLDDGASEARDGCRPGRHRPSTCTAFEQLPQAQADATGFGPRSRSRVRNPWGFPQGQGRLVGAQLAELPIPKALAAALNGTLDPTAATEQAQVDLEEIAR